MTLALDTLHFKLYRCCIVISLIRHEKRINGSFPSHQSLTNIRVLTRTFIKFLCHALLSIRLVSSMIHSERPTVLSVAIIIFTWKLLFYEFLKIGGRTNLPAVTVGWPSGSISRWSSQEMNPIDHPQVLHWGWDDIFREKTCFVYD